MAQLTREQIKEILPHREPMLLVDEVHDNDDGTVTGSYTVRGDEYFLQGHFPEKTSLDDPAGRCAAAGHWNIALSHTERLL